MDGNWDLYRSFLAVLRTGSLSAAARSLGLTQPTMGRHIEELENHLGSLFVRSPAGLTPTELGTRLKSRAEALETNIAALIREATQETDKVSGVVRVTAPEIFSCEWLPTVFANIHRQNPGLKIELVDSNRVDNLLQREADIAVRLVQPEQDVLISKAVGEIEIGLHAHKTYLQHHGTPKRVEDLPSHTLIGYDTPSEYVRAMTKRIKIPDRSSFTYRTDNDVATLALIRAGCGIGFCQTKLAGRDKQVMRILPNDFSLKLKVWIVMHEDLRTRPAAAAVFKGLTGFFQKEFTT